MEAGLQQAWLDAWSRHIVAVADRERYCDREVGEEIGWLVSPFLSGFHHGHAATGDTRWVDRLMDWADAWIRRGVVEPDGHLGWPKAGGASTAAVPGWITDSLLGEAMALRPVTLMADAILRSPGLSGRYGPRARAHLSLSEQMFQKWDERGCWREVAGGGLWVVPPFGLDARGGGWTEGYARRHSDGFSLPANKQNLVALWMLALHRATGRPVYRERAASWWSLMRARIRPAGAGGFVVWNYWDPAGPWDRRPDGTLKHWVGVHPNGGYYAVDVAGMVAAHESGLVFGAPDLEGLIATNRDFMWNGEVDGARFRRIDGGAPDPRWERTPGCLWTALAPYDPSLRRVFLATHNPAGWGGLDTTPWYLARLAGRHGDDAPV